MKLPIQLPALYDTLTPGQRRDARIEYVKQQNSLCAHCGASLWKDPTQEITSYPLDESTFPPSFFSNRIHLHHDHMTGLTVGAVHARCNAVLKRYHGV